MHNSILKNLGGRPLPLLLASLSAPASIMAITALSVPAYAAQKDGYSLTFVDADVQLVVEAVMGDMLRLPYSIDPEITGTITLQSPRPVSEKDVLPMLERSLLPANIVVLKRDGKYMFMQRDNASALLTNNQVELAPVGTTQISSEPGFATDIVALNYIGVTEMVGLARDLIGGEIVTRNEALPNSVKVSGTASERAAARDLIARFDIDSLADMRFAIWKMSDAQPSAVIEELNTVFTPPNNIFDGRVRLVPLPRIRSIMGIAADENDLNRIEPWIRRIEQGSGGKRVVHSYSVQNGKAREMAQSLQQVLGLSDEDVDPNQVDPYQGYEGPRGPGDAGPGYTPPARNYGSKAGLRIVPNDTTNTLLIYANAEEFVTITRALDEIDRPSPQVMIEAILAEVTLTDDLRYGVNFQALGSLGNAALTIASSATGTGTPAASFPGFSVSAVGNDATGILNALQSKTNVRVLSAPKLQVMNNRPATLQVGDQVPIVTQQAQSVDGANAPLINTVQLRDTGVILQVTPRISDNGTVLLEISQEVSDVAPTTTSGINSPTIQQRRLTTTVVTQSGQMVVLGGLIRNRQTREKGGIPGLSQIPIIGGLFGRKANGGSRTELIILISPSILRGPNAVRDTVDSVIENLDLTKPLIAEAQGRMIKPRP